MTVPKSKLEYHLFARFSSNGGAVRIGVFLSERKVREIGNAMHEFADDVWYRTKVRRPDTKPYRKPLRRPAIAPWRSTL